MTVVKTFDFLFGRAALTFLGSSYRAGAITRMCATESADLCICRLLCMGCAQLSV